MRIEITIQKRREGKRALKREWKAHSLTNERALVSFAQNHISLWPIKMLRCESENGRKIDETMSEPFIDSKIR